MMDEPDLVALFYRADWTRLSLSAEVHEESSWAVRNEMLKPARPAFPGMNTDLLPEDWGSFEHRARLRIAPGGRYLLGILSSSDTDDPPDDGRVLRTRYGIRPGLPPPYPTVLWPSSLLNAFSLELAGQFELAGRVMLRVIATPAPGVWRADAHKRPDRIDVTADAETGIPFYFHEYFDGRTVQLTELTDVTFDPPGGFEVPDDAEDDGQRAGTQSPLFSGPRWMAAKTAANVLGTMLGTAAEHAPGSPRGAAAWKAALAEDDPEAVMPAAGARFDPAVSGSPASTDLVHALYRSGRAQFSATLHQWIDAAVFGEWAQERASDHGWGGIGSVAGALGGRAGTMHQVTRVTIGGGGRYRLDFLRPHRQHSPKAVAYDGSRSWREYDDRVVVGPVLPLPKDITAMIDTAVLLDSHVSDVAQAQVSGRRGFALRAVADPDRHALPGSLQDSDLVVDAELGIALRQTAYANEAQVMCYEFRELAPLSADGRELDLDVPPGIRVEHTDGWLLEELSIPDGMRSAIRTAGSAAKSAHAIFRSLRRR